MAKIILLLLLGTFFLNAHENKDRIPWNVNIGGEDLSKLPDFEKKDISLTEQQIQSVKVAYEQLYQLHTAQKYGSLRKDAYKIDLEAAIPQIEFSNQISGNYSVLFLGVEGGKDLKDEKTSLRNNDLRSYDRESTLSVKSIAGADPEKIKIAKFRIRINIPDSYSMVKVKANDIKDQITVGGMSFKVYGKKANSLTFTSRINKVQILAYDKRGCFIRPVLGSSYKTVFNRLVETYVFIRVKGSKEVAFETTYEAKPELRLSADEIINKKLPVKYDNYKADS